MSIIEKRPRLLRLTLLALVGYLTAVFGVVAGAVLSDLRYSAVHSSGD